MSNVADPPHASQVFYADVNPDLDTDMKITSPILSIVSYGTYEAKFVLICR